MDKEITLEDLGFVYDYVDDPFIYYERCYKDGCWTIEEEITFNFEDKTYECFSTKIYEPLNDTIEDALCIDMELHIAISNKMKELGWLQHEL